MDVPQGSICLSRRVWCLHFVCDIHSHFTSFFTFGRFCFAFCQNILFTSFLFILEWPFSLSAPVVPPFGCTLTFHFILDRTQLSPQRLTSIPFLIALCSRFAYVIIIDLQSYRKWNSFPSIGGTGGVWQRGLPFLFPPTFHPRMTMMRSVGDHTHDAAQL